MERLLSWSILILLVVVSCSTDESSGKSKIDIVVKSDSKPEQKPNDENKYLSHNVREDGQLIPKEDCIEGVIYYYYRLGNRGYYTVALDTNTKVVRCDESNGNKRLSESINSKPAKKKSIEVDFKKYMEYQHYLAMKKELDSEEYKKFKDAQEYFGPN